jgi:anti-anti-sigma factor
MATHGLTLSTQLCPDGVVVVGVSGELDIATAPELDDYLIDLASTGHHRLILDTARLTFCDVSGIRVMIRARARADAQHGMLSLMAVSPRLRRILTLLALLRVLPAADDLSRTVLTANGSGPALAAGGPVAGALVAGGG